MDGVTSASPLALFGSLLVHAAFGAAVIGYGSTSTQITPPKAPDQLAFFETEEPAPAPEPAVEEPPAVIRRVVPRVAPAPTPKTDSPAPTEAPAPVTAPAPLVEQAPVVEAPVLGVAADTTVGEDAKGFAVGSTAAGAKTGGLPGQPAQGAATLRVAGHGLGDRSRAAGLADGRTWDCPFPQEADDEGIEDARVTLQLEIGADNAVQKAVVVSDPGFGFGQEARRCALRRRWLSQLNREGMAIAGRATVVVTFTR